MIAFLILRIIYPPVQGQSQSGVLFYSFEGPGSQHAPLLVSLVVAILVGFIAQRSRFCTMGALRDLILFRNTHLFLGILSLVVFAFLTNLILGQFHPGFANQPIAHSMSLWNFLGMALAGLAFALAGGCPGRQLFLAGEGDGDAALFVLGMIVGAAFAHNFGFAASPKGIGPHSIAAIIIGFAVCLWIGFAMRQKQ
jgi:YedE family putative selenium metabolism protein